jgi:hypothetical protein
MLTLSDASCESLSVPAAAARAYLTRVNLQLRREAAALERALAAVGAEVERDGTVVTAIWPASEADEIERWEEYTFTELVFFLRSWAGTDPRRRVDVLEERVL